MKATVIKRLNKRNFPSADGNIPLQNPHEPGDIINVVEEVRGSILAGTTNDTWFRTDKGYYVWSGGTNKPSIQDRHSEGLTIGSVDREEGSQKKIDIGFTSQLEKLNNLPKTTGKGVTVFVLDSGIDSNNQVFRDRVIHHWDEVIKTPLEKISHGTQIASILADNRNSIVGLAPNIEIVSLKVIRESGITKEDAVKRGFEFVKKFCSDNKPYILNLSFSTSDTPDTIGQVSQAIKHLMSIDIPVIVAGNRGNSESINPLAKIPGVISVAVLPSSLNSNHKFDFYFNNEPLITSGLNNSIIEFKDSSSYTAVITGIAARIIESEQRKLNRATLIGKLNEFSEVLPSNNVFRNFKLYRK